ncbi:MAG TPA: UDP-2,3-diacylglucosamine diphosphatase [bacterium]|nr:UDP-2,3-diacylglucosamine diphosphatase [bacterium]HPG83586.1 UDP-2,3-diacylglucosamine diphosphatase [bacterium]
MLGDAHLGAQQSAREEEKHDRLISFWRSLHGRSDCQLVLCGDLFDFWFEYRHVIPRRHFRILVQLADLVDSGVPVDYLAGNHDFWMGSFLRAEAGVALHEEGLLLLQAGRRIFLRHGDGLMAGDHLYRLMKRVLRHPAAIAGYRLLHPDLGIPFALFCSHLSRESARDKHHDDTDYRAWACRQIDAGHDLVVLGHSHVPALLPHGGGWYVNAGAWMEGFTYAMIEAGVPSLRQWDGREGRPYEPLPAPNDQA